MSELQRGWKVEFVTFELGLQQWVAVHRELWLKIAYLY